MTVLTKNQDPKQSINSNHDLNQDTHSTADMSFLNGENGRVSCEVTRKTASQVVASEPKEIRTAFGNATTDPKLLHLIGEKLFFTCYNGEKPKPPVVLIARPRIFAIFHRRTPDADTNSTETDDSSSGENVSGESNGKEEQPSVVVPTSSSKKENAGRLVRNRRDTATQEQMECTCMCPKNK